MRGKVRHFHERGYGFISCPDSENVFFHISDVSPRVPEPAVGDVVEFSLSSDGQGRPCAKGVHRINQPADPCGPVSAPVGLH